VPGWGVGGHSHKFLQTTNSEIHHTTHRGEVGHTCPLVPLLQTSPPCEIMAELPTPQMCALFSASRTHQDESPFSVLIGNFLLFSCCFPVVSGISCLYLQFSCGYPFPFVQSPTCAQQFLCSVCCNYPWHHGECEPRFSRGWSRDMWQARRHMQSKHVGYRQ